jgi:hypothetical protein
MAGLHSCYAAGNNDKSDDRRGANDFSDLIVCRVDGGREPRSLFFVCLRTLLDLTFE